jgi:hypothetical protein
MRAALLSASLLCGCAHADVGAYAATTAACVAAERVVTEREYPSEETHVSAIELVHGVCSDILLALRRVIESGE